MTTAERGLLAINVGSATIKAAYYRVTGGELATSSPQRAKIDIRPEDQSDVGSGDRWLSQLLARLPDSAAQPDLLAHRVVHGGARTDPAMITDELISELAALTPLAPLHQTPALRLIDATRRLWGGVRQFAVFDTSWHSTLAPWARRLPLPAALHAAGVMRYGFHGLAFASAMRQLTAVAPALAGQRLVLAHLGGGSSVCAVARGRSIDTTMGMTPLDGVPMATRSGTLDPGVVLYLAQTLRMPLAEIEQLLWRDSGLRGISGLSGDMRELLTDPGEAAALAREQYAIRVAQAIAAMATSIGGMDVIVFSGGIGDGAASIRERIATQLHWTGLHVDRVANLAGGPAINAANSAIAAWVFRVDEERELALVSLACDGG